ncbi:MAG TPA: DUF3105 domain-containing protein, partial [Mycobacteriales bacterium]|nr:DUF3105 domain-containing protein [Mycobacteriales bacterium]
MAAVLLTGCAGTSEPPADGRSDRATGGPTGAAPTRSPLQVDTFEDLSHEHVRGSVAYPENPPVGGPHSARWLACDVYDEPVPPEAAVHSMEHGAVWVTYRPGLDPAGVAELAQLAELDPEHVLVSPYGEELPTPVVASSWGAAAARGGAG